MVDYDVFKRIADKLEEHKENAFATFGLKGDIRFVNSSELTSLMVKYKSPDYSEEILLEIAKLMVSNTQENKTIAVVGPQGVGKSTLMADLERSIKEQLPKGGFNYLDKISDIQIIPFKMVSDENFDFLNLIMKSQKSNSIWIFEDCQELFFDENRKTPSREAFQRLMKRLDNFEHSVFIFTFNAFGWKIASSKIPDLTSYYNRFIWLNGLDELDLKDAIEKRLCFFSIKETQKIKINDLFQEEKLIEEIIKYSSRNPRLAIRLVSLCIELSFERKLGKITEEVVKAVLESEGIEQYAIVKEKDLLGNKVLYSLLSYPFVSTKIISSLIALDRTTIQRDLENQIKFGRVIKKKNESNKKEYLYGIKKIPRAYLEQLLMDRIEKKTEFVKAMS